MYLVWNASVCYVCRINFDQVDSFSAAMDRIQLVILIHVPSVVAFDWGDFHKVRDACMFSEKPQA